jgi:hypothetical protein
MADISRKATIPLRLTATRPGVLRLPLWPTLDKLECSGGVAQW